MICTLTTKDGIENWCERHKMQHRGHYAAYAVDLGEKGEKFRKYWDELLSKPTKLLRSLPLAKQCQHNTGVNGTTKAGCGACTTYGCSIKGTVKLSECVYCESYQPPDRTPLTMFGEMERWQQAFRNPPDSLPKLTVDNTTRNLIYHIYPVAGNNRWQWNVEQLCGRLKCFNGKIIVAIVTDPPEGRLPDPDGPLAPDRGRIIRGCDSADEVKAEFAKRWSGKPIKFMEMENDPKLREVKPLIPMLEEVLTDDPYSITLYAQAKVVTRAPGHIAHRWTEALYEIMLDYFPLAIEQMNTHPVTGCFKKLGPGWSPQQSKSDWHYSGSWFWFRTASLAAKAYWNVDQFWSGIEPYPSQQWLAAEAGCMFHTEQVPAMNLYNGRYWGRTVNPAFNEWRAEHGQYRTTMWPK